MNISSELSAWDENIYRELVNRGEETNLGRFPPALPKMSKEVIVVNKSECNELRSVFERRFAV